MLFTEPISMSDLPQLLKANSLSATIATQRPTKDSFSGCSQLIGVAAVVSGCDKPPCIWGAGYAASEDMARAWPIVQILEALREDQHLTAHCRGLDAMLQHVRNRRLSGNMEVAKNNKNPVKARELFEPLELARSEGRWSLRTFGKKDCPDNLGIANKAAAEALAKVEDPTINFEDHRQEHPCWFMFESGIEECPEAVARGTL
ncbi:hypothetical protein [Roseibium album]|uniref:hypothetical protein n=1 Tax=Roseibium album TaxID=311410 RepID=UPI00329A0E98